MESALEDSRISREAMKIWSAGVAAVDSRKLVQATVSLTENELWVGQIPYRHDQFRNILVVGAGKASGWMAEGLELALGRDYLTRKNVSGRVNVPDDQIAPTQSIDVVGCRKPGSNLPTDRVLESTNQILELVQNCHPDDLCICLISGGGSALLEKPIEPVILEDLRLLTKMLSSRGADIDDLNLVRRQLSAVKGGGLVESAGCKRLISLIISDVIGDPIGTIASGPTVPQTDRATATELNKQAINVLQRYFGHELEQVPTSVLGLLQSEGLTNRTGSEDTEVSNLIIGNNEAAVEASRTQAAELGYEFRVETNASEATAESDAHRLVQRLKPLVSEVGESPFCFISGGEPTVNLCEHPGQGGRNQHLVLAAMLDLLTFEFGTDVEFCILSGGTDGEDGNVPVAGARFDSDRLKQLKSWGTDIRESLQTALASNNSFPILNDLGCIIRVPPTRTNVCDLRVLLCRKSNWRGVTINLK